MRKSAETSQTIGNVCAIDGADEGRKPETSILAHVAELKPETKGVNSLFLSMWAVQVLPVPAPEISCEVIKLAKVTDLQNANHCRAARIQIGALNSV